MDSSQFPALARYKAYLNTASRGIAPRASAESFCSAAKAYTGDPERAEDARIKATMGLVEAFHRLYGFREEGVGVGESTTHCLTRLALAAALPRWKIIMGSWEFPGVYQAITTACESSGCSVQRVDGWPPEEALEEAVEEEPGVIVASAVTWVEGYRLDIGRLSRRARKTGSYLIVDSVQHFGALTLRDGETGADAYAASVKKWLLAPHSSIALCYSSSRLRERDPPVAGLGNLLIRDWDEYWLGGHEKRHPLRDDGHRFSAPTGVSLPELEGARASLSMLADIGVGRIEKNNLELARHLVETLEDKGITTSWSCMSKEARSSIVLVEAWNRKSEVLEAARRLLAQGFMISARGRGHTYGVRVSMHLYNSLRDVEAFADALIGLLPST